MTSSAKANRGGRQAGFTLIEVLIALLVLGVGLLGFALLQTMNVRFTKSAQQRTVASNLAYEVIDIMRTQNKDRSQFNAIRFDSFGTAPTSACTQNVDATPANNIERWKCEVATALPEGKAQVDVDAAGVVEVTVRWGDQNWMESVDDQLTSFTVTSRI